MSPGAVELKRMAYLQAMGIDSYVSRGQLRGAAPSCRLALVSRFVPGEPATSAEPRGNGEQGQVDRSLTARDRPSRGPAGALPRIELDSSALRNPIDRSPTDRSPTDRSPTDRSPTKRGPVPVPVPAFTMSAMLAGGFLWLEELNYPVVATAQVQLVQAMARALGLTPGAVAAEEFNWPIHQNSQFDLGEDAARAALTGYVCRRLEQFQCQVLVALGEGSARRLSNLDLPGVKQLTTVSTAAMLADPGLKRQAWRDLLPLVPGK